MSGDQGAKRVSNGQANKYKTAKRHFKASPGKEEGVSGQTEDPAK
jgi:hypothetical protein